MSTGPVMVPLEGTALEVAAQEASVEASTAQAAGPLLPAVPEAPSDLAAARAPAQVQRYLQAARSPATRRAYASDWTHFDTWCAGQEPMGAVVSAASTVSRGVPSLPATAATVAAYLATIATTHKVTTLIRRCSAISAVHQAAGYPSPTTSALVRTTLAGIRRTHRVAPAAKDPLLAHQVRRLLDALPTDPARALITARDRALLVIGFYGALRRSELVALDTADVEANEHALVLTLRRSKTDQDGAGRRIALLHTGAADSCPVETYLAWRAAWQRAAAAAVPPESAAASRPEAEPGTDAGDAAARVATLAAAVSGVPGIGSAAPTNRADGAAPVAGQTATAGAPAPFLISCPVFCPVTRHGRPGSGRLSDRSVARIVQRSAARAGLAHLDVAGHSLRAGFATSAAAAGKSERAIMRQTGHTSLPMVRRYIREGSLYRDNATDGLVL